MNLSAQTTSANIETKMDSGRTRVARRSTTDLYSLRAKWDFTDAQYLAFRAFFKDTLLSGSDWFTLSVPMGGSSYTTVTCRFANGSFSARQKPVLQWDVSASLELQTNPITAP